MYPDVGYVMTFMPISQEHDSFRSFRSQNLNLTLALETKPTSNSVRTSKCPVALLFNSTLRYVKYAVDSTRAN